MGSGSFPLHYTDKAAVTLKAAADSVQAVCDGISDDVYSGDSGGGQFDNAASDGASLAMLRLAVRLIREQIR
jgi:hypothetical protein